LAQRSPSPSVKRIAEIARALGDLSGQVVFIGGAIAPLLQTNPPFARVRATKDVDAVVASANYADYGAFQKRLRELGFNVNMSDAKHAHRWRAPDGTPFDLVPVGDHFEGTGGEWDKMALQTAVEAEIEPGLRIRHASAPGFLALKWAAFWDRGAADPYSSHDLEDILALTVSRDTVVEECRTAPGNIQESLRKGFGWLTANPEYDDLVAAHLANAQAFKEVAALLRDRISQISATSVNK
jgi:predicted nucleotidyltransferase